MALMETNKLTMTFGGLAALSEVDFQMSKGEIVGLIGPNGAGKTTFFNCASGVCQPTSGRVMFEGQDIVGLGPDRIARRGLTRTFQATSLFAEFDVLESVILAHHLSARGGFWGALLGTAAYIRTERQIRERALEILEYLGLAYAKDESARGLPYGHQKALGLAMALATEPKLLLLDEPVAGMNPVESETMMRLIRGLRDEKGLSILIVEHDMKVVMGLCERVVVLNSGRKIAEGTPREVATNDAVIEAYLGKEESAA